VDLVALTKEKIARRIEDVCQFGLDKHGRPKKATQIVAIVLDSIKEALYKHDTVTIWGLGKFRVSRVPAHVMPTGAYAYEQYRGYFVPSVELRETMRDPE
jgi:nucleoid DNA-binding protein